MKNTFKRIFSSFLTFLMVFSVFSTQAMAIDVPTEDNYNPDLVPIEDVGISREEALESFNATEAEAENAQFYVLNTTDSSALGPGQHNLGTFQFTGSNGGSYRTINGNKVRICIRYIPYGPDDSYQHMQVYFLQYGGKEFWYCDCYPSIINGPDEEGCHYFNSDWIDIDYGVDYRFTYYLITQGDMDGSYPPRTAIVNVIIWVE